MSSSSTHKSLNDRLKRGRLEHNAIVNKIKDSTDEAEIGRLMAELDRIKAEIAEYTSKISAQDKVTGFNHGPSSPSFAMKRKDSYKKK